MKIQNRDEGCISIMKHIFHRFLLHPKKSVNTHICGIHMYFFLVFRHNKGSNGDKIVLRNTYS